MYNKEYFLTETCCWQFVGYVGLILFCPTALLSECQNETTNTEALNRSFFADTQM